ncbi:MAG: sialidase family protein, partial [Armatimonadota bacterium]
MYVTAGLLVVLLVLSTFTTASAEALFETQNILKKPVGDHGYRGIMGGFIQLKDGTLLLSFTDGDIKCLRSTDQGKTWTGPEVLVKAPKPPAGGYICHPSFLRAKNGDLLLAYIHSTHPATPYFATNYLRRSS